MRTHPRIVAIGGGEMKESETLRIDTHIVELTGKRKPEALFIPTASGDSEEYIEAAFEGIYGRRLGCNTSALRLVQNPPSRREMSALVLNSDLIYVGGGNTYRMMRIWRRLGLDTILKKAASRGIVMSGLSAGAICWFRYGHSDSRSFSGKEKWRYIRISGLGIIDALFCPHYHAEKREASLAQMMAKYGGLALACDNSAAIEIAGDTYRVVTSSRNAKAYRVFKHKGGVVTERLRARKQHAPLEHLLTRTPTDSPSK